MRVFGFVLVVLGLLICLTIIGIPFGLFLIFVGIALAIVGGHRRTVINNVIQVSNSSGPAVLQTRLPDSTDRWRSSPQPSPLILTENGTTSSQNYALDSGVSRQPRIQDHSIHTTDIAADTKNYDVRRWGILKEIDPDIAAAAQQVSTLSPSYEDAFAEKFLTLGDKKYLEALVNGVIKHHAALEEQAAQAKASVERQTDESKKRAYTDRRARSLEMMDEIKSNAMFCRHTGKYVSHMEICDSSDLDFYGFAILTYQDGSKELRSGEYFTQAPA